MDNCIDAPDIFAPSDTSHLNVELLNWMFLAGATFLPRSLFWMELSRNERKTKWTEIV